MLRKIIMYSDSELKILLKVLSNISSNKSVLHLEYGKLNLNIL